MLTATPNRRYYKAVADVTVWFKNDEGEFVIVGDDSQVTDDELFQLFESEYEGLPKGWAVVGTERCDLIEG